MIKKNLLSTTLVTVLAFLFSTAAMAKSLTPPVYAMPDADRQTWINNLTDSVATMGMEDRDKEKVKLQRKNIRKQKRIQKEDRRRNTKIHKQMKNQNKVIMNKINAEKEAAKKNK